MWAKTRIKINIGGVEVTPSEPKIVEGGIRVFIYRYLLIGK
tara:strand:+ start:38 stop:160 length:123 start_codon:yes stop_codon:yes gene_type:complete